MNIIIPYRHEVHNGLELRYALRSIEKYLSGYGDIYLIGDKFPNWVQNVKFINVPEPERKTSRNILIKIMAAFDQAGETVLQWQDDIYLTNHMHTVNVKYWYEGTLEEAIEKTRGNYKLICINTAYKITDLAIYYDIHTPIIYERQYFKRIVEKYKWHKAQYLVKSLYCRESFWPKPEGEEMKDCKLNGAMTQREIKDKINGNLFFSTSPQAIDPVMIEVLNELYPDKSKYEKD